MKFVKSSFFSARRFSTIEQVRNALSGWCERKNNRIHKTTFRVPAQVFEVEPEPTGTMLRVDPQQVAQAMGDELTGAVIGLLAEGGGAV